MMDNSNPDVKPTPAEAEPTAGPFQPTLLERPDPVVDPALLNAHLPTPEEVSAAVSTLNSSSGSWLPPALLTPSIFDTAKPEPDSIAQPAPIPADINQPLPGPDQPKVEKDEGTPMEVDLLPATDMEQPPARPRTPPPAEIPAVRETTPVPLTLPPIEPLTPSLGVYPSNAGADRTLDVADALSYLDNVKLQFYDRPNVYNQFLDIMKDFKSQAIDTPGVITRVSSLFNGHPTLIQGFNTFLPVGYRIECSTDSRDVAMITVTTPTGTTTHTTAGGAVTTHNTTSSTSTSGRHQPLAAWPAAPPGRSTATTPSGYPGTAPDSIFATGGLFSSRLVADKGDRGGLFGSLSQLSRSGSRLSMHGDPDMAAPPTAETIEPALQYVQKIKARFADDPDTYHNFLEVLQKYHSQPPKMTDAEVVASVTRLFKNAPDLLQDFRGYLPMGSALFEEAEALAAAMSPPHLKSNERGKKKGEASSSVPQKRKRKAADKDKDVPLTTKEQNKSKKLKQHHTVIDAQPAYLKPHETASPHHRHAALTIPTPAAIPSRSASPPITVDERQFFERVKRGLDSRESYTEFLKLLNLFTQNIIDTPRLVSEARSFLGDGDLMRRFKDILGFDEARERALLEGATVERRPMSLLDRHPKATGANMKNGPSYRRLPAHEINTACAGRDEICRSVLNDEWVSHPTWASEDAGFFTHKKNIYEEALHRSEEERHEYDFYVDAATKTINIIETNLIPRVQSGPPDTGKGGKGYSWIGQTLKAVHHRVLKKIYGRDAAPDVVKALIETPHVAIPVVLQRLKQKEDEWKRAQREWNQVWQTVDALNYPKSLDHQGITFKASDKKAITAKAFVSQIEAARAEHMTTRAALVDPLFSRTRPRHQLAYVVDKVDVLQDVLKMTFSFLDRTQGQVTYADRKRVEAFLRKFVPVFFMLDVDAFNTAFVTPQVDGMSAEDGASDGGSVAGDDIELGSQTTGAGTGASGRGGSSRGRKAGGTGDLRKKLLKSEQAKSTQRKTRAAEASPPETRHGSPAGSDVMQVDGEGSAGRSASDSATDATRRILFANTPLYVLLRLIELLYARLALFKQISDDASKQPKSPVSLVGGDSGAGDGLDSPLPTTDDTPSAYNVLLEFCERLFDNEVEQVAFEDRMRLIFGVKHAYQIFTVDKVIGALIKQVQVVLVDKNSARLLSSLYRQAKVPLSLQDPAQYRRDAEKVLGPDEDLFRIDFLAETKMMTVQLLGKDDDQFIDADTMTERWRNYVDSYVLNTSEPVRNLKIKSPFLRKNLLPSKKTSDSSAEAVDPAADGVVVARHAQEVRVCLRTYRLFYVSHTEDALWRVRSEEEVKKGEVRAQKRLKSRQEWLDKVDRGDEVIPQSKPSFR